MVGAAVSSSPETSPAGTPRSAAGASPMSSIKKAMQNTALARGISKKMKKKSGSGSGAAAGSPASASGATSKKAAPKPMWRATKDKTSGNTYYYHTGTKETSWIKPSEYDEKADMFLLGIILSLVMTFLLRYICSDSEEEKKKYEQRVPTN